MSCGDVCTRVLAFSLTGPTLASDKVEPNAFQSVISTNELLPGHIILIYIIPMPTTKVLVLLPLGRYPPAQGSEFALGHGGHVAVLVDSLKV